MNPWFAAYLQRILSFAHEYVLFGATMALDPSHLWLFGVIATVGLAVVAALQIKFGEKDHA